MAEELILPFILESIRDLVIHEVQFLNGVEDQVQILEEKLNNLSWFLRDTASANQERVLHWVIRVRYLAYQAEYLIETYAIKVASRRQQGTRGTIKRITGVLNECYHRHQIGSDIETLMKKLDVLYDDIHKLGVRTIIENRDDGASSRRLMRRAYSTVNDEDDLFVGSDDSINMLAEKLVSNQYRTICLYGMGGLGKTTLAKKLYHHPDVTRHFDGFAWVSITKQWHTNDILRGILTKLIPQKRDAINNWREEELVRELSQLLRTSKCLLVLDDIWAVGAWNSIKSAIHINENGNKVLLTTRNVEVGTLVDASGYRHTPKFLSDSESWELLRNKALRGQGSEETTGKERIGKEIIPQCGGLPLVVVALGGILSSKSSDNEWESVRDNLKSYLLKDREGNVNTVLVLSYDDLPFQLKPCFLYLSKYAEDAEIAVETLYQYWMAEGMVSSKDRMSDNETLMDVAEHYLNELAERCMVFVEKDEKSPFTRFKSCRLHDLMRDMCISKAKEEKFLESRDYGKIHDVDEGCDAYNICRLSISFPGPNDVERFVPPTKTMRRSFRSFTLDGDKENTLKFNFSEFVMLRVLSVAGVEIGCSVGYQKKFDPLSIGKLVHLRYLCLRKTAFPIMWSLLGNLKKLQTLDLSYCDNFWSKPGIVWKLPRLNHLYLPPVEFDQSHLTKKLGFDGMPQLEILEGFNNKVCNVNHLSTLTNLRKLEATVEDKVEELEVLINHVRKLNHLRCLRLTIIITSDISSEKGVGIMNDILSYTNLVTLDIEGKLSKFPEYESGICPNLRSLVLWGCFIEEDSVGTLERLPNLRDLSLHYDSYVGKEMSCHASGFPQLTQLALWHLPDIEKWEIEDGAMPNLSRLTIGVCSKLEMIPAGLRSNTLLKKLYIHFMPEEFLKRVRRVNEDGEEGEDYHKIRHIQTIQILY